MSHRALVARSRSGGRFDVYLARDGATDESLTRLLEPDARLHPGIAPGPPDGRARSVEELLAAFLDPIEHEALLLVRCDGTVAPYVVLPSVLATAEGLLEGDPPGVALALVGHDGATLQPAYVRGWFQGTAGVLGEAVDGGLLSADEAFTWLSEAVDRLAGGRHERLVLPTRD